MIRDIRRLAVSLDNMRSEVSKNLKNKSNISLHVNLFEKTSSHWMESRQ